MSNTPQTKKGLGTFDFFCVGFGAIVGVGWAVSLTKWMASAGGPVPAALGYRRGRAVHGLRPREV